MFKYLSATLNFIKLKIYRITFLKNIFFFSATTLIIYLIMLLYLLPMFQQQGKNLQILDLKFTGYNLDYVNWFLNNLTNEQRKIYLCYLSPLDFLFLCCFAVTFASIFIYLSEKSVKKIKLFKQIFYLPILAAFFDLVENVLIIIIMNLNFQHNVCIIIASAVTIIKGIFYALVIMLTFAGLIQRINYLRDKQSLIL